MTGVLQPMPQCSRALRGLLGLALLWTGLVAQAAVKFSDEAVKSELLTRFARYSQWPADSLPAPDTTFVIGIWRGTRLEATLREVVNGLRIHETREHPGRNIEIRLVASAAEAGQCHLVYFSENSREQLEVLQALAGRPVLTVGEGPGFVEAGGLLAFELLARRTAYRFNPAAMDRAGLQVGIEIIRFAIKPERGGGRP